MRPAIAKKRFYTNLNDTTSLSHVSDVEDVCERVNALFHPCFIHRLPTEILEPIFIRCAHNHFRMASGRPVLTAPSWTGVAHVNRHWRNVALNCPTLWAHLFVTSRRWTEQLLVRSKQEPLKLNVDLRAWDEKQLGTQFLEQVMVHSERIEELQLHIPMGDCVILSRLCTGAPRLKHLEISADPYHHSWSPVPFDGDTPALRTLRITGCPVPWHSLNLSRLTTLALHELPDRFQQNVADLLATLDRMKDLKHLYLDQALTSSTAFLSSDAFRNHQKISLSYLSQFSLFAPLSTTIALCTCLHIPLETEVRLGPDYRLRDNVSSINDYNPLCLLLADRYCTVFGPTIRTLAIEYSDSPYICTKLVFHTSEGDCGSCLSTPFHEWGGTIPLQIFLTSLQTTSSNDRHRLVSRICYSMPLSNVRSLHVLHPPFPREFWVEVLEQLQEVQYVQLSYGTMPDLVSMLSCVTEHDTSLRNPISVPALERLDLHNISFSTARPRSDINESEAINVQSLYDALSSRTRCRGRLTMTRCIERLTAPTAPFKRIDLEGEWGGGRFSIIYDDND